MNIIEKYSEKIKGQLSGFDRIIINGFSRQLNNNRQFLFYLIQNNCQLKDFKAFAEEHIQLLCNHIDKIVKDENRPTYYVQSPKVNKDEIVRSLLQDNPVDKGLVCAISTMELCDTMTVKGNRETKKVNGIISNEQFKDLIDNYNKDEDALKNQIKSINNEIKFYNMKEESLNNYQELINKYQHLEKLNKIIIDEFIDKIYIDEFNKINNTRNIKIKWNFD